MRRKDVQCNCEDDDEHCHAIWQLYKKLEGVIELNSKTNDLVLLLKVLKLFPIACRYEWHGLD